MIRFRLSSYSRVAAKVAREVVGEVDKCTDSQYQHSLDYIHQEAAIIHEIGVQCLKEGEMS